MIYNANPLSTTWDQLFAELQPYLSKGGVQTAIDHKDEILHALQYYESMKSDYANYVNFDRQGYTKTLVEDYGDACNVIIMCWDCGQSSLFHGHEQSRCFVKVLEGQLVEQQVVYPTGSPEEIYVPLKERFIKTNDIAYIDDSIGIHKMGNRFETKRAVSLHIYMPSYRKCRIFRELEDESVLSLNNSQVIDVTFQRKR